MLGVGSFGYVRLASHRDSGTGEERVLALKAMRKDHLVKKRQVGHLNLTLTLTLTLNPNLTRRS